MAAMRGRDGGYQRSGWLASKTGIAAFRFPDGGYFCGERAVFSHKMGGFWPGAGGYGSRFVP